MNKAQLREMISELLDETQWGGFTGGAAPLDEPPMDSGAMSPEQQQKVFDILVDTGSDPEELKASGDYPDVFEENIMNIKNIIREELKAALNEEDVYDDFPSANDLQDLENTRRWESDRLNADDQYGSLKQITDYANDVDNLASNLVAADGEPQVSNTMDYIRRQMFLIKELVKQHQREMEGE
tara:strand:+ start:1876 stop:2424 length:549 start_codon:yes stop_codon:yes gene_type:complete